MSVPIALRWALLIAIAFLVQVGISAMRVDGVALQLLPMLAVCAGVIGGAPRGAIVGFWAGLLFDLVLPGPLGLSALAYCLVAFAVGSLQTTIIQMARGISVALVAAGSATALGLFAVLGELWGTRSLATPGVARILLVVAVTSGLMAPLMLRLARWAEGPDAHLPGVLADT